MTSIEEEIDMFWRWCDLNHIDINLPITMKIMDRQDVIMDYVKYRRLITPTNVGGAILPKREKK